METLDGILNTGIFELGGVQLTLGTIATGVVIVLFALVGSKVLQRAMMRQLRSRGLERTGAGSFVRLLHYVLVLVGVLVALQTAGVKLGALFAAGAIFAIGLGFAMQNIAQNFVAGFILLAERSIKPGDIIELDGEPMRVEEMGIRATLVRTLDDEQMIVPNSLLVQSMVTNLTLNDSLFRIRAKVGVAYSSDVPLVRATLLRVALGCEWRDSDREPRVIFKNFGDSSLEWEASVWTQDPWHSQVNLSDFRERIWAAFKEQGIVIAFPQLDVHLDADVIASLSGERARAAERPESPPS